MLRPGEHEIAGTLRVPGDRGQESAKVRAEFPVGKHKVAVEFDSPALRRFRVDGPFKISLFLPGSVTKDVIDPKERLTQDHTTQKYLWKKFKGTGAEFTGGFSDRTRDTDGDGRIDVFSMDIEVMTDQPGAYEIEGWLSLCGDPYVNVKTRLEKGKSKVALEHSTRYEFSCRYQGGYGVKYLKLSQAGVMKDFIQDTGVVTRPYSYTDFRTPPVYFNPASFRDVTKDNWVGGHIPYLEVSCDLLPAVKSAYSYTVSASLVDSNGEFIADDSSEQVARPDGTRGLLTFSGEKIRKSRKNGPYRLRNVVLWGHGEVLDQIREGIQTRSYRFDQFASSAE